MKKRQTKRGLTYNAVGQEGSVADNLEKLRRIVSNAHLTCKSYQEIEDCIIKQWEEEISNNIYLDQNLGKAIENIGESFRLFCDATTN